MSNIVKYKCFWCEEFSTTRAWEEASSVMGHAEGWDITTADPKEVVICPRCGQGDRVGSIRLFATVKRPDPTPQEEWDTLLAERNRVQQELAEIDKILLEHMSNHSGFELPENQAYPVHHEGKPVVYLSNKSGAPICAGDTYVVTGNGDRITMQEFEEYGEAHWNKYNDYGFYTAVYQLNHTGVRR